MELLQTWWTGSGQVMVKGIATLLGIALLVDLAVRYVGLRVVHAAIHRTPWRWDDLMVKHKVFRRLGHALPFIVVHLGVGLVPSLPESTAQLIRNLAMAGVTLFCALSVSALLSATEELYRMRGPRERSIKGLTQMLQITVFVVSAVIIVSVLINRQPLIILSGLGALSAVLMLIFKDTLLGFVAGVQISTNDLLRVGDWIEMPSAGADGAVIDIALHTVKVQNWDKTITTIPTWKLIDQSYKNWRGMSESGGRRIKRSLYLDVSSARFLTDEETEGLKRFHLLERYIEEKRRELEEWNRSLGGPGKVPINQRRMTNLGVFRAYALAYLRAHPQVHPEMTCMVRQLPSTPEGLPMEMYCFTRTVVWGEYERIQSDIFDHLIAILPAFGLRLFQNLGGGDVRLLLDHLRDDPRELASSPAESQTAALELRS